MLHRQCGLLCRCEGDWVNVGSPHSVSIGAVYRIERPTASPRLSQCNSSFREFTYQLPKKLSVKTIYQALIGSPRLFRATTSAPRGESCLPRGSRCEQPCFNWELGDGTETGWLRTRRCGGWTGCDLCIAYPDERDPLRPGPLVRRKFIGPQD